MWQSKNLSLIILLIICLNGIESSARRRRRQLSASYGSSGANGMSNSGYNMNSNQAGQGSNYYGERNAAAGLYPSNSQSYGTVGLSGLQSTIGRDQQQILQQPYAGNGLNNPLGASYYPAGNTGLGTNNNNNPYGSPGMGTNNLGYPNSQNGLYRDASGSMNYYGGAGQQQQQQQQQQQLQQQLQQQQLQPGSNLLPGNNAYGSGGGSSWQTSNQNRQGLGPAPSNGWYSGAGTSNNNNLNYPNNPNNNAYQNSMGANSPYMYNHSNRIQSISITCLIIYSLSVLLAQHWTVFRYFSICFWQW